MAVPTQRNFTSTAVQTFILNQLTTSTTVISVNDLTGYPPVPFTAVIDRGQTNEEVIEVTGRTGLSLTVTRAIDNAGPYTHEINATFDHDASARDFNDANSHVMDTRNALPTYHLGVRNVFAANIGLGAITGAEITNSLTLGGTLAVTGTTTLNGNVTVSGSNTVNIGTGAVSMGGTLTVGGVTQVNNIFGVSGASTLNAVTATTLSTSGLASLNAGLSVIGTTQITGSSTFTVGTGASQFGGTVTVTGATQLNNTLGVTGTSTLAALNAGATTTTTLTASGNTQVSGSSTFTVGTGATQLGGTLTVTGATQVNNTLGVLNGATFSSTGYFGALLTANAGITSNANIQILNPTSPALQVGRTSTEAFLAVASSTGNYSSDAQIGDTVLRSESGKLRIGSNSVGVASTIVVTSTSSPGAVAINGTLGVSGTTTLAGLNAGATTTTTLSASGNTQVTGSATFSVGTGSSTLGGSLTVTGATQLNNTLGVTGTSTLAAVNAGATTTTTLSASGNTQITGASTLTVGTGATSLGGTLTVTGATQVNNTLGVTGTSTLAAVNAGATTTTTLSASGNTQVTGSSTFSVGTGSSTLGGTLTVSGATQINNTLGVTGTSTLAGLNAGATTTTTLSASGNTSVTGASTFTVGTGATSLGGPLTVTGATQVNNTLGVTGTSTLAAVNAGATTTTTLAASGNTSVTGSSTFSVGTGASTLGGSLTVAGATQLNNTLNVTGFTTLGALKAGDWASLYQVASTGSGNSGLWTRVGTTTITAALGDSEAEIFFLGNTNGNSVQVLSYIKLYLRIKQQQAFGSLPYVEIVVEDQRGPVGAPDIQLIIDQDTPTTIATLWMRVNTTFQGYGFWPRTNQTSGNWIWFSNDSYVASPTAGVATYQAIYADRTSRHHVLTGTNNGYLDLGAVAANSVNSTNAATGDKINLYGGTTGNNYGLGMVSNRVVAFMPSTAGFAVRTASGGANSSIGADSVVLLASGDITNTRDLSVGRNATVTGTLGVTGTTTLAGNTSVTGTSSLTVGGTVGISGLTTVSNNLRVNPSAAITLTDDTTYGLRILQAGGIALSLGTDANNGYIQTFGAKPLIINGQGNVTIFGGGGIQVTGDSTFNGNGNLTQTGKTFTIGDLSVTRTLTGNVIKSTNIIDGQVQANDNTTWTDQVVEDGNFEDRTVANTTWSVSNSGQAGAGGWAVTNDAANSYNGVNCAVHTGNSGTTGNATDSLFNNGVFAAVTGETWTASAFAKQSSGLASGTASLKILWYNSAGGLVTGTVITQGSFTATNNGSTAYVNITTTQIVPTGAVRGQVVVTLTNKTSGTIYMDAFSCRPGLTIPNLSIDAAAKLIDKSITAIKLGDAILTATEATRVIASGALSGSLLTDASTQGTKLANATVTGGKVAIGTILGGVSNVAGGYVGQGFLSTLTGNPTGNIGLGTITEGNLMPGIDLSRIIGPNGISAFQTMANDYTNLVEDPGFEQRPTTATTTWGRRNVDSDTLPDPNWQVLSDGPRAHAGQAYALRNPTASNATGGNTTNASIHSNLLATTQFGEQFYAEVMIRSVVSPPPGAIGLNASSLSPNGVVGHRINFHDSAGQPTTVMNQPFVNDPNDNYRKASMTATAPLSAVSVHTDGSINSHTQGFWLWDDFRLQKLIDAKTNTLPGSIDGTLLTSGALNINSSSVLIGNSATFSSTVLLTSATDGLFHFNGGAADSTAFLYSSVGATQYVRLQRDGTVRATSLLIGADALAATAASISSTGNASFVTLGASGFFTASAGALVNTKSAGGAGDTLGLHDTSGSNVNTYLRARASGGIEVINSAFSATTFSISDTGDVVARSYAPQGLPGATNASRYVGGTTSGPPTTGTFSQGDHVVAADGGIWVCVTAGTPGTWIQPKKTFRTPHTFTVSGEVFVPSGDSFYIPPMFVSIPAGTSVTAVAARHRINSGTSATITLQRRSSSGTTATIMSGVSVTTTSTTTDFADVALSDNDDIELVVTAVSGNPKNMSVTIFLDVTA